MTIDNLEINHHQTFESIKKIDKNGNEFWLARQLQPLLEYASWDKFMKVIQKAKESCHRSGQKEANHFSQVGKMVDIGTGARREISDVCLSRYACYLIVQNGDPSKSVIANGQSYFAIQTRRQELSDDKKFAHLSEDEKRLMLRDELTHHNISLTAAAKEAGVETSLDYAIFQDHGYKGLYGGIGAKKIHTNKGLKKSQKILDYMDSTELAANLFRSTQTEEKLRRDNVNDKKMANKTHFAVGTKVRNTIKDLGGTMPENLPTPKKSIQSLVKERQLLENTE